MHRVENHSQNLSFKWHDQKFCINIAISAQHWIGLSIEKYEKFRFSEYLIKMLILVLNQLQNQQFDLLFLAVICSSENDYKYPSKISIRTVTLLKA